MVSTEEPSTQTEPNSVESVGYFRMMYINQTGSQFRKCHDNSTRARLIKTFKFNICNSSSFQYLVKCKFCDAWVLNFLLNFKGSVHNMHFTNIFELWRHKALRKQSPDVTWVKILPG